MRESPALEALRAAQDAQASRAVVEARARVLETRQRRRGRSTAPTWALALAASVVAAVVVWTTRTDERGPVSVRARGALQAVPSAWLSAGGAEVLTLEFSDGASVDVAPSARAQVVSTSTRGAVVSVAGRARVEVPPGRGAVWRVEAGPYLVVVTGTEFDVAWDEAEHVFELTMYRGSVDLSGPALAGTRHVGAGERVRLGERAARAEAQPTPGEHAVEVAPTAAPPAPLVPAPAPRRAPPRPEASTEVAAAPPARAWAEALHRGDFTEGLAAVPDFEAACRTGDAAEVLLLADAARYARWGTRSELAYQQVRERFPGTLEAGTAAFSLGRASADAGRTADAVRWFELYLAEQPAGPLVAEALGRSMELRAARGERSAARAAAERYLREFPAGPHASEARRLREVTE